MRGKVFLLSAFLLLRIVSIAQAQNSNLTINRPESNGLMNSIPCIVYIKNINNQEFCLGILIDLEGSEQNQTVHDGKFKNLNYMFGGDKIVMSLPEGIYEIQAMTPVSMQENYLENCYGIEWVSNIWIYDTQKKNTVLYIKPGSSVEGYNGTWIIYE